MRTRNHDAGGRVPRDPIRLALGCALGLVLTVLISTGADAAEPRLTVELEGGALWQQRNQNQIPNDATATRFSLVDLVGSGPFASGRLYLTWNLNDRHGLRFLAAPLEITGTGTPTSPIVFAGHTFDAAVPAAATYRFDSWRVSYRYRFLTGDTWTWRIGFTGKVRDAEVKLSQGDLIGRDTNVGFVPLLHLAGSCRLGDRLDLEVDLDALAGGPGRAEDLAVKVAFAVNQTVSLTAGYRTIEGGADVDEVYSFAWLNYLVLSTVIAF